MAKASQEKTAFVTPWGKYQFVTMPFGLVNAPSTFQHLMDQLLEGTQMFTAAYLDDVIIHSRCWEEHLEHLREILTRLRKAGLTIKESKCKFARNECEYLGHTVGNGKVHPLQAKVQVVQDFTRPITKKDVRAFLGLCGYYRLFIPDFSTIATPLTELTRKDKPNIIVWGKETQQSFQHLKDSLTHYPVLATSLWERPFILQTDASDSGIAYVLAQRNEIGEEHPLAYGSRKLLPRERKFSTIEKEALAIVEGTRHFRIYLEGTEFTIETDHDPLTHLAKLKDSHGRIGRWALSMQPYHYTINHKPGRLNTNANGLSREYCSCQNGKGVSEKEDIIEGKVHDHDTPLYVCEHNHSNECKTTVMSARPQ